jgi:hypothetical protein
LALGRDWTQLREQFAEDPDESERINMSRRRMLAVIDWLETRYIPNA